MAARAGGSPSVGEYCSASALSSESSVDVSSWRTSTGNVSGAGKPPESVMTSVDAASERIAVSSSPPRLARRANSSGQTVGASRSAAAGAVATVDTPIYHLQTFNRFRSFNFKGGTRETTGTRQEEERRTLPFRQKHPPPSRP